MRSGYLNALASRTLGVAPVLGPVVPSRFEPAVPEGALQEIVQVTQLGSGDVGTAWPHAAASMSTTRATADDGDGRLLGAIDPPDARRRDGPHADRLPPMADPERSIDPLELSPHPLPSPSIPDWMPREVDTLVRASAASAGQVEGSASGRLEERASLEGADAVRAPVDSPPARGSGYVVQTSRAVVPAKDESGDRDRPGASSQPSIVVRIGRVDVRAIQEAPRPAPARRSAPESGPSLADHLMARERGRQ